MNEKMTEFDILWNSQNQRQIIIVASREAALHSEMPVGPTICG